MKKYLIILIILLLTGIQLQAKPVAGVTSISWDTTRGMTIATLLEQHTLAILKNRSLFDTIAPGIINRELARFECFDEKCILPFARNAGISLLINGNVQDRDTYLNITLRSYGVNGIFNGRLIHSYTVKIPLDTPIGSREFSLICEEHSARFLAATLASFRQDIKLTRTNGLYRAETDLKLTGNYTLYSREKSGKLTGGITIKLENSRVTGPSGITPPKDAFIIMDYKKESSELDKYYKNRKREIVFHESSIKDTLYMALLTPFASASMPFSSPYLGYYMNNDWQGLGLWMVNATPYIYMEARGLINTPERIKDRKEDVSRDDAALYYFGWYMAAAGGLPLFIDSYANNYLKNAASYSEDTRLLGNNFTAAYLSLVSNGGGMFYKGNRGWGYFYFHINNIILYMTIRDFVKPEKYNDSTGEYVKKDSNSDRGKKLCAVLAVSKIVETVHTLLTDENLSNGTVTDDYSIPEPFFTIDSTNNPVYGISFNYRF